MSFQLGIAERNNSIEGFHVAPFCNMSGIKIGFCAGIPYNELDNCGSCNDKYQSK
jgi:hypothetical protein